MSASTAQILVMFPGALGDLLCCWPAIDALIDAGHAVTLAARAEASDLLPQGAPHCCPIDRREVGELFASGPISDHARRFFGAFDRIDSFTGATQPGFADRLAAAARGTVSVHSVRAMRPGESATAYFARCLGVVPRRRGLPLRADAVAWAAALWRQHALGDRVLAIQPGSGGAAKNWEGMPAAARAWRDGGGHVVALLGPAELERGTTVPADVVVAGARLASVAAILARAHRYLGNDSGISHLAGLVGIRAVVLFGNTDPDVWAPAGTGVRVLRAAPPCGACGGARLCTHRLSLASALAALS